MPRARAEYRCMWALTFPGMIRQPEQSRRLASGGAVPTSTIVEPWKTTSPSTTRGGLSDVSTVPPVSADVMSYERLPPPNAKPFLRAVPVSLPASGCQTGHRGPGRRRVLHGKPVPADPVEGVQSLGYGRSGRDQGDLPDALRPVRSFGLWFFDEDALDGRHPHRRDDV